MNRILKPIAGCYGFGVTVRDWAYRRDWLKTRRLQRPVISVGNLTVGGTGKTPFVRLLAEMLLKRGVKPSVLTRGYGRQRGFKIIVIEPRPGRAPSPRDVGDEPALLARTLPEVPIIVCADRYQGGLQAEQDFNVKVHLLDDGFQHRSLARDVDIVLVDVTQRLSDDALLPAGRLREPLSALVRAHIVILTRTDLCDPSPSQSLIRRVNPRAKIFSCTTSLCGLREVSAAKIHAPEAFRGKRAQAFCGVGNPGAFFSNLRRWQFILVKEELFGDHHLYTGGEITSLLAAAKRNGATAVVTTEKDSMNLPPLGENPLLPILACVTETQLADLAAFEQVVMDKLPAACRCDESRGAAPMTVNT